MVSRATYERGRRNSTQRGYGKRWGKVSRAIREREPLCRMCRAAGKLRPAACVDHIRAHQGRQDRMYDEANLQPLCATCHAWKSQLESIGVVFGWPVRSGKQVLTGPAASAPEQGIPLDPPPATLARIEQGAASQGRTLVVAYRDGRTAARIAQQLGAALVYHW